MIRSSRAARFEGDGHVRINERDLAPVDAGEVRLAVTRCGLCGSDKRLLKSGAPQIPGHEIVGVVVAHGPGATAPSFGTRCAVFIPEFCGRCSACRAGDNNRCADFGRLIGWQRDGGFADHVDVPAQNLIPIPDDISDDLAVLVLDTVGTSANALRQAAALRQTGRVLIVGCGPLGLGSVIVASALGFSEVAATDPVKTRREAAYALGAHPMDSDPYDVIVEASGATPARAQVMNLAGPGAVVLMLGESNEPWVMPATPDWRRTEVTYIRTFYFPLREVSDNFDIIRANADSLGRLLDVRAPLSELQTVFEDFTAGRSLKPLIVFPNLEAEG
jgi:threonine dehydrogenase-like Zn-dependent dehydrogenase